MLHITNNAMKKTALVIMVLFVFAVAGCEDAYKASSPENNNTVVRETINIDPVKSLEDIIGKTDGSLKFDRIVVIENGNRELDFKLVPESNNSDEIVDQYNQAHQKNTDILKKLLPDNPDDPETQAATDRERVALDSLSAMPKTLETIMVSSVTIIGPQSSINNFKRKMEE